MPRLDLAGLQRRCQSHSLDPTGTAKQLRKRLAEDHEAHRTPPYPTITNSKETIDLRTSLKQARVEKLRGRCEARSLDTTGTVKQLRKRLAEAREPQRNPVDLNIINSKDPNQPVTLGQERVIKPQLRCQERLLDTTGSAKVLRERLEDDERANSTPRKPGVSHQAVPKESLRGNDNYRVSKRKRRRGASKPGEGDGSPVKATRKAKKIAAIVENRGFCEMFSGLNINMEARPSIVQVLPEMYVEDVSISNGRIVDYRDEKKNRAKDRNLMEIDINKRTARQDYQDAKYRVPPILQSRQKYQPQLPNSITSFNKPSHKDEDTHPEDMQEISTLIQDLLSNSTSKSRSYAVHQPHDLHHVDKQQFQQPQKHKRALRRKIKKRERKLQKLRIAQQERETSDAAPAVIAASEIALERAGGLECGVRNGDEQHGKKSEDQYEYELALDFALEEAELLHAQLMQELRETRGSEPREISVINGHEVGKHLIEDDSNPDINPYSDSETNPDTLVTNAEIDLGQGQVYNEETTGMLDEMLSPSERQIIPFASLWKQVDPMGRVTVIKGKGETFEGRGEESTVEEYPVR